MTHIKIRTIPEPKRFFAVGDIHGCYKELDVLLTHFKDVENLNQDDAVVFIGDYIDRGPNSKKAVDLVIDLKESFPNTVTLMGNHEDMFMGYMGFHRSEYSRFFIRNGGGKTLQNYFWSKNVKYSKDDLPKIHQDFYSNLELAVQSEKYFFSHAGLDPAFNLNQQTKFALTWIRNDFYFYAHTMKTDKIVVHGHTPHDEIGPAFDLPYRINLDSACVFDGYLTGLIIDQESNSMKSVSVKKAERKIVIKEYNDNY